MAHPRIQVRVLHAPPIPEYTDDAWCLYDAQRTLIDTGQALVLALGAYTDSFLQEHFGLKLLTQPVRGQLSYYPLPPILPEGWPSLASVAKKSMIPARLDKEQQALFVGASFDRHRDQAIIDHTDRQTHLQYLAQNHRSVFDFLADLGEQGWQDFAGVRSMLADRLPVVGAVNGQKNVYILSGLGSRGFSLGLLCGELLASQINAHPWPVSLGQGNSLDCNRYLRSKPD
ncbi:MAG: FAD-dependent oxidoreductase [Gammaproteobacteria bacterium]|nr:FAD-dependent oxidoreductase [Gammaproteobacteria bacterium]